MNYLPSRIRHVKNMCSSSATSRLWNAINRDLNQHRNFANLQPYRTLHTTRAMAIELVPLPLPASADPSKFADFGREVKGVNIGEFTPESFKEIEEALYKVYYLPSCFRSHS